MNLNANDTDRARIVANCRLDAWQRLRPKLATLHVSSSAGPDQIIDWLDVAFPSARPEAQRVLRALARRQWRVDALTGPYENEPRLGFCISAGSTTWWLQFRSASTFYLHCIERVDANG